MSLVDEKMELGKMKIDKDEDPENLFNHIRAVETRFNAKTHETKEAESMAVVMSQAPKTCQAMLTSEQRMKKQLGIQVTMSNLEDLMKDHYELINNKEIKVKSL